MPELSDEDLELSGEYREAIGTITANATILDHTVDQAIWVFLRVSPTVGRLITEPMTSTARKIELMRGIGTVLARPDTTIIKRWSDVGAKVSSANKLRSQVVHARWVRRDRDETLHTARFEPGVEDPIVEPMPIKKLHQYSDEIAIAQRLLLAFLRAHGLDASSAGTHHWPPRYRGRPPGSKRKTKP